jgi:hypothetical protein
VALQQQLLRLRGPLQHVDVAPEADAVFSRHLGQPRRRLLQPRVRYGKALDNSFTKENTEGFEKRTRRTDTVAYLQKEAGNAQYHGVRDEERRSDQEGEEHPREDSFRVESHRVSGVAVGMRHGKIGFVCLVLFDDASAFQDGPNLEMIQKNLNRDCYRYVNEFVRDLRHLVNSAGQHFKVSSID